MRPTVDIDVMLKHYVVAALWSTNDESDEAGGDPMDDTYGPEDVDEGSLAVMRADCEAFLATVSDDDLAAYLGAAPYHHDAEEPEAHLGHDLWLTRNRHGVGFWDRSWLDEAVGRRLTDLAHAAGERWLYVGDDGRIHQDITSAEASG